jgi:divalent metal cation (Fe/Co/Zn/Cd) transporter
MAIEVSFTPGLAGDELTSAVDEIERRVREKYPDIQRIFIEAEAIRSSKNQVRSNSRVSPV